MTTEATLSCVKCVNQTTHESLILMKPILNGKTINIISPVTVCDKCDFKFMTEAQMDKFRVAAQQIYLSKYEKPKQINVTYPLFSEE